MSAHVLKVFGSEFLEEGVIALCDCGWRSRRHITEGNAIEEHLKHREQALMKPVTEEPNEDD